MKTRIPCLMALSCLALSAQDPAVAAKQAAMEKQAEILRNLVAQAPKLPLERVDFKLKPPSGVAGWEIGYPSSVAMDKDGLLYILQRGTKADPMIVADQKGNIIRSWGAGMYKSPHSVRIAPDGNIWTVDSQSSMVYEFTPMGKKLMEISIGEQPTGRGATNGATDIAFAPNGHLFISDGYGNSRVLEYTPDGKRITQWGSAGEGPGQFHQPHGIAISKEGIIYVADRRNGRLQRFDMTGKFLGSWDDLGMVCTVTINHGDLWIGTQQRNESTEADGWMMKLDPKTGKILGLVVSGHSHHVINVTDHGDVVAGARPDKVVWQRPTK